MTSLMPKGVHRIGMWCFCVSELWLACAKVRTHWGMPVRVIGVPQRFMLTPTRGDPPLTLTLTLTLARSCTAPALTRGRPW